MLSGAHELTTALTLLKGGGGECRFSMFEPTAGSSQSTVATVLSPSLLRCTAPSTLAPGEYEVGVSLNGGFSDLPSLFAPPIFEAYDPTMIHTLLPDSHNAPWFTLRPDWDVAHHMPTCCAALRM